jgi:hypothetical protein
MPDVGRPDDYRNRQSEGPPEFVAEHGDGMSRVAVMPRMPAGHCVPGVRMNRLGLRSVTHLAQGKTPGTRNEVLQGNESTNAANIQSTFSLALRDPESEDVDVSEVPLRYCASRF